MRSKHLDKVLAIGEDVLVYIGAVLILAMMMISVSEIIGRTWFSNPIKGSEELPSLFLILVATISMAAIQRRKQHIGVNILQQTLKGRASSSLEFFLLLITLFVASIMAVYGWQVTMEAKALGLTTMGPLFVIQWPAKLLMSVAFGFLGIRLIIQLIREGAGIIRGV